jgi:hypothetical protein
MGARVVPSTFAAMEQAAPDLVVIDDPSVEPSRRALQWARRLGVAVASVHDLGLAHIASDLRVDASLVPASSAAELSGPDFTILDPSLLSLRTALHSRLAGRIVIALGGGAHVRRYGAAIARGIADALPGTRILVAPGFHAGRMPALPEGAEWLRDPSELALQLSLAAVAVVGGGVTLAEGCAVGAPMVATAVAPSQRPTIAAFASAGAVFDAGQAGTDAGVHRVVAGVMSLTASPTLARRLSLEANGLVDGRGAFRVAAYLSGIVHRAGGHADAA